MGYHGSGLGGLRLVESGWLRVRTGRFFLNFFLPQSVIDLWVFSDMNLNRFEYESDRIEIRTQI
jgi:hypothetical protein